MTRAAFSLALVVAFAAGAALRDQAQEWRDEGHKQELIAMVRACPQYTIVDRDGRVACRAMMPRFEIYLPVKPLVKRGPI